MTTVDIHGNFQLVRHIILGRIYNTVLRDFMTKVGNKEPCVPEILSMLLQKLINRYPMLFPMEKFDVELGRLQNQMSTYISREGSSVLTQVAFFLLSGFFVICMHS